MQKADRNGVATSHSIAQQVFSIGWILAGGRIFENGTTTGQVTRMRVTGHRVSLIRCKSADPPIEASTDH